MPEGDTIHYAANRIRPILEGHVPDEIATPHPRFRADRWPERLAGRAVARGRRARQAPLPALRGRPDDPLAPAHDRRRGARTRAATAGAAPAPRLARPATRRRRGRAVRRPGPRADDRLAHALRPADRRPRARTSSSPSSTSTSSCAACARTTRRARSATRCSTSARSPGSATCGRSRAASRRASTRGGRTGEGHRRRGAADRPLRPPEDAAVGDHGMQDRYRTIYGKHGQPCPRCGAHIRRRGPVGRQPPDVLVRGLPDMRRVGHKGADLIAPGNTVASFDAALAAGVDMIEFDVLPEHTDGTGELLLAHDYGDLRRRARQALTLEEGLAHFRGDAYAGVELERRPQAPGLRGPRRSRRCARTASPTARWSRRWRRPAPRASASSRPRCSLGWSVPRVRANPFRNPFTAVPAYAALQVLRRTPARAGSAARDREGRVDAVMANRHIVTPALVRAVLDAGGEVYVWTVDEEPASAGCASSASPACISNDPRLLRPPSRRSRTSPPSSPSGLRQRRGGPSWSASWRGGRRCRCLRHWNVDDAAQDEALARLGLEGELAARTGAPCSARGARRGSEPESVPLRR